MPDRNSMRFPDSQTGGDATIAGILGAATNALVDGSNSTEFAASPLRNATPARWSAHGRLDGRLAGHYLHLAGTWPARYRADGVAG